MKRLLLLFLMVVPIFAFAKGHGWICADHAKDYSWWLFVYDDIKRPELKYDYIKVWIMWEYSTPEAQKEFDTQAVKSKQLCEFSYDFTSFRILQVVDYNKDNKVIQNCNIPSSKSNIIPGTVGEQIAETAKEILDKQE